jgi:pyruvate formate lyase activating enzyme
MSAAVSSPEVPLVASPYDLRVGLSENKSEAEVRAAVEGGELGFLHSFTTGSAVDGPGMRVVVWTAGCQFRCQFCHNPDTWKMTNGIPVTLTRALEEIRKYPHTLKTLKGGLTISGGEPLLQRKYVINVFKGVRQIGVHTALDTNGSLGKNLSDEDLGAVDLVLLGLKAVTPDVHRRLTNMDNDATIEFARRLASMRKPIWIRFVVVPGFTDDPTELQKVAEFAASLGNVERIDVLPFHQMGRFKWEKLGMEYKLKDAKPPSRETVNQALEIFKKAGLKAV